MGAHLIAAAFYKAPGDWTDKAVRLWTRGPYSHCELVIGDLWLSASPREGMVRFKNMTDATAWDFIPLDLDVAQIEQILRAAEAELGCGYDWLGIVLTQIINLNRQDPKRWFCSELITNLLQTAGYLPKTLIPHQIDPNELFILLGGKHHAGKQKDQGDNIIRILHNLSHGRCLRHWPQLVCNAG